MAKVERQSWTREQLFLAMNLYCRLPFGKQHSRNPEIVKLANAIGRTPGSVAMKLNNFSSLDPDELRRGVRGLQGTSKLDRKIWADFHADWDGSIAESGSLWEQVVEHRQPLPEPEIVLVGETETMRLVRLRITQRFFRDSVLASYNERCCITDNPIPALLEAAHIRPWADSPEHRSDPRNGLCLSRIHHAAFDLGLFTLNENFRVVLSDELREYLPDEALELLFVKYEGKRIRLPEKFLPDQSLLESHRQSVFKR